MKTGLSGFLKCGISIFQPQLIMVCASQHIRICSDISRHSQIYYVSKFTSGRETSNYLNNSLYSLSSYLCLFLIISQSYYILTHYLEHTISYCWLIFYYETCYTLYCIIKYCTELNCIVVGILICLPC